MRRRGLTVNRATKPGTNGYDLMLERAPTLTASAPRNRSRGRDRFLLALALLGVAVGALVSTAPPAAAAFPGQNGKIAFTSGRDGNNNIYVMNADGSAETPLTSDPASDFLPAWSSDGENIAFTSDRDGPDNDIFAMNADGSGKTPLTSDPASDSAPAWSPDSQRIAFTSDRDGNFEIYAMNADGSAQTRLTSGPAFDFAPAWSPDGQKIAFMSGRTGSNDIYVMNPDGSAQTRLTTDPHPDWAPVWSPDGQKIAFESNRVLNYDIHVMNADGSAQTRLTGDPAHDLGAAWSPDGQKIAFYTDLDPSGIVGYEISVINANGSGQTPLTNSPGQDIDPDWQPLPDACPDIEVGFATAQGCFTETEPGSGIFETTEKAWVGGFEIQPRPGGKLVLDTGARSVSAAGAGVDMIFAGFPVPIPVALLPVGVQNGTLEIGVAGTATGVLGIPVESTVKVEWTDNGKSATYEQEVKIAELTDGIGDLVTLSAGESLGAAEGKLKAKLQNGTGFVLESGEISIDEVNVIPRQLRVPQPLKLKNLLLKFEIKENKPFWTGRAGISWRLSPPRGRLDVTGTGFAFDGSLAGAGLEVDGLNVPVGPLILQKVGGDLIFAPDFGVDLRVGAEIGPRVGEAKLAKLDGTLQAGSVVSGCLENAVRPDPAKLEAVAKLSPLEGLEEAGLAEVKITQRACIYPGTGAAAAAIEGTLDGELTLLGAFGYKGVQTGFISTAGASYEGSVLVRIPALPDLDGSAILSTVGVAACTDLVFFDGGIGYTWRSGVPAAFTGCDLGDFRLLQSSSAQVALEGPLAGIRAATSLSLPSKLPHAGFAAKGTTGPPPVTLTGPGGFSVTSPADGSALRSPEAVIIPVAADSTTYVFVDDPRAGAWSIDSLDPTNPLVDVALSEGLAEPKVKGRLSKAKPKGKGKRGKAKKGKAKNKLTLAYSLRRIPGQKVVFTERSEGIANELGKAKGKRGKIAFKATLAADRKRTIEAEVIQDGIPREILKIARFKAPPLPKLKVSKLKARRKKKSMIASWAKVAGSSQFLVGVRSGNEDLFRVLTARRKLRFATPAKGKLKLSVQALSESRPPGPVAKLAVKPAKGRKGR